VVTVPRVRVPGLPASAALVVVLVSRERWRKVRGWPHQVSDRGRVRSMRRALAGGQVHGGGLLTLTPDKDGYPTAHLRDGGREWRVGVHVLVATYFPCYDGLEVRHLNGDRADGCWTNLRWGTHRENERDKRPQTLTESGSGGNGEEKETEEIEIGRGCRPFPAVSSVSGDLR
jgi:hypothetical protein